MTDGTSYITCCKTIKILSGVTGFKFFSCRETPSKGNTPSKLESKATEHIVPDPIEYLSICQRLNPQKLRICLSAVQF